MLKRIGLSIAYFILWMFVGTIFCLLFKDNSLHLIILSAIGGAFGMFTGYGIGYKSTHNASVIKMFLWAIAYFFVLAIICSSISLFLGNAEWLYHAVLTAIGGFFGILSGYSTGYRISQSKRY